MHKEQHWLNPEGKKLPKNFSETIPVDHINTFYEDDYDSRIARVS